MCDPPDPGTGRTRKVGSHRSTGNEHQPRPNAEEIDRPSRWAATPTDEDHVDDLRREYGTGARSAAYWAGFNAVKAEPKKKLILLPKTYGKGSQEAKDFLEGVNDARHKLNRKR